MATESKLVAEMRDVTGTGPVRRLRRDGWLPASINTEDRQALTIKVNEHDFERMLHTHSSENVILDLSIQGDKTRKVLVKDVQHDPLTDAMLHVDFFEISMTETMRVSIPIELTGEPVGVEQDGGILEHVTRELEVECLPGDLVEQFEIDVSALTIGDAVQVSDIQVSDKFDVITEPDVTVASVTAPRPEEEEEPEEVEEGEPEVIGEKKEEGEEETEGEEKEEEEGS